MKSSYKIQKKILEVLNLQNTLFASITTFAIVGAVGVSVGRTFAYGDFLPEVPAESDTPWTQWYRHHWIGHQLYDLAKIRGQLNRKNLHHIPGLPTADDSTIDCSLSENKTYRRNDGWCNDFESPAMGAAGTQFGRNAQDPLIPNSLLTPNPLKLSRIFLSRPPFAGHKAFHLNYEKVPLVNLLAVAWIQFMNHDWMNHTLVSFTKAPVSPPFEIHDTDAKPPHLTFMRLSRSPRGSESTQSLTQDRPPYPVFSNEVTHWWDGSQIYGSHPSDINCAGKSPPRLRTCQGGKMLLDSNGLLPLDPETGDEVTGMRQNWWLGLSLLHTLFVRNHNRIADLLNQSGLKGEENLFHRSRLINVAIMAKIHTLEWTPTILDHPAIHLAMKINWYGLKKALNSDSSLFRYFEFLCHPPVLPFALGFVFQKFETHEGCAVLEGFLGGKKNLHAVPYSITEEFTSVYRMHSFLPDFLDGTLDSSLSANTAFKDPIPISITREKGARIWIERAHGIHSFLNLFGQQNPGALRLNNYPHFLRNLPLGPDNSPPIDLGAVDIIRDRERGVPRYNDFRRQLGLRPIDNFEQLSPEHPQTIQNLKAIYQSVEDLDLLIGTLAEGYRPPGFAFGETLFQVFILMASRRLQADRFFTDDFRPEVYTKLGLSLVEASTFKSVIESNVPELTNPTLEHKITIPENAFSEWF